MGQEEINRLLKILEDWPNCILVADEIYDGLDFRTSKSVLQAYRAAFQL